MPKIDIAKVPLTSGTIYPGALADIVNGRSKKALGNAVGLDQFGVNLTRLEPGSGSAHRHWHASEDEFVYIISGEVVLIEDTLDGVTKTSLCAGDAAGFKAGVASGHHLMNTGCEPAIILEIGSRHSNEDVTYTDKNIDMSITKRANQWQVMRRNGKPHD